MKIPNEYFKPLSDIAWRIIGKKIKVLTIKDAIALAYISGLIHGCIIADDNPPQREKESK